MVNLRKLLTNICTSIKTLLDWKTAVTPKLTKLQTRGEFYEVNMSSTTAVSDTTYTNIVSLTLPPGRWIIYGELIYSSNTTGRRYMFIGSNSAASNTWAKSQNPAKGMTTRMNLVCHGYYTTNKTVYLVAYHSAGSNLNVTGGYLAACRLMWSED